jgi:hypothetical protein
MYSQLFINQFIELRAKRISIKTIMCQLRICKATAVDWNRRYKAQIAEARALHIEAACERAGLNYEQEVAYAAEQLNRIRAELKKRKVEHVSTEFLYNAEVTGFARMEKLLRLAEIPDLSPEPADDAVEPAAAQNPPGATPQNQTVSRPFPDQNGGEGGQNHAQLTPAQNESLSPFIPPGNGVANTNPNQLAP